MDSQQGFFCHLPYVAIETNGKNARPCCEYTQSLPLNGYEQHPILLTTKHDLWQDQVPSGCTRCHESEKHTGKSLRILAETFHPEISIEVKKHDKNYSHLRTVSVTGSNVCNLKCLPCELGSFTRSQELYKLGFLQQKPSSWQIQDPESIADLDFSHLILCAGEPLYDKNSLRLLEILIERKKSRSLRLDINTNLTGIDQSTLRWLTDNFDSILIKGSIDAVGSANDYLRYPSSWHQIESAVDLILANNHVNFVVTTALSNLSLLRYHDLVEWSLARGIEDMFITQVQSPRALACGRFFQERALDCLDRLGSFLSTPNLSNRTKYCIDLCMNLCKNTLVPDSNQDFADLRHFLDRHDEERGTNWRDVWPELKLS